MKNRTQTMRFYPFVFTGKELDPETGYGYFGARYMDHELMTMWLSVDPMADKYPSISPYAYCAWNPVKLVDPDGREFGDIYNLRGQHIGSDGRNDNVVYLKSTWSNRQLSTVESNFLIMFGGVKSITEETGLTNNELNLRATLSTIKQAEAGRKNPPLDYNSWNGSDHFTEDSYVDNPKAYARHPGTNPNTKRSASGAYQFLKKFWDSDDFGPQAQDKAAVNLMTKSGYEAALNGDMAGFINSSSKRWTSLSQWEVSDLQDEFCYNRAKELVGKTNIATPIGSLLKKNSIIKMVSKLGIWIICTLLFVANGTVNAQKEMEKSISVDTLSISLQDGSSLMLETFYYGDTLDEMCKTYGFVYPIIITQNVYFMVNDTVVKKRVLDCLPTHKHKYKNEGITIQTLPVFDIGVYEGADSCFYYLEGACFCCGVMCPEYLGIYKMDGTLLYEVIAAMDYEYCNGYKSLHDFCVREGVDINNSVQQRSNHKLFQHEN